MRRRDNLRNAAMAVRAAPPLYAASTRFQEELYAVALYDNEASDPRGAWLR